MIRSYSALLFWFGMAIAASLMLYHTSDRTNALDLQLRGLNHQIEAEQQSLHVLKAEWVYLANPARVEAATRRHLALQPTETRRVMAMNDIGKALPLRDGDEPVYAQTAPSKASQITDTASADPTSPADAVNLEPKAVKAVFASLHTVAHNKNDHIIAALNAGHVNDHMIIQHASVSSADSIGSLIGSLGLRQ
jgi:hypothetical protein